MKGHNLAYEDGSSVDSKQSIDTLSWVVRDYMKKGNKLKSAKLASILRCVRSMRAGFPEQCVGQILMAATLSGISITSVSVRVARGSVVPLCCK